MAPSGIEKMSDVLTDFVEPYADLATTEEAYRRLLTLAILAWNASLRPDDEQEAMVDDILRHAIVDSSVDLMDGLSEIVRSLIARKKAHFADNRRMIIDFSLRDTGDGYYVSVASTMENTKA